MRLSVFAGEPRLVSIGGEERLASKLRVRDVARLESWMELVASVVPEEDILPDEPWPPTLGSPSGSRLLGTSEGLAMVVFCSLRQLAPGLTIDDARELAQEMTEGEGDVFFLAVFPEPVESSDDGPGDGRPMEWRRAILDLIRLHHYTPDQCLSMPLDQFFSLFDREDERPSSRPGKRWAVPIKDVATLERLLREREARSKGEAS